MRQGHTVSVALMALAMAVLHMTEGMMTGVTAVAKLIAAGLQHQLVKELILDLGLRESMHVLQREHLVHTTGRHQICRHDSQ